MRKMWLENQFEILMCLFYFAGLLFMRVPDTVANPVL